MFVIRLIEKLKILCAVLAQRTDIVVGKELPFVDKAADLTLVFGHRTPPYFVDNCIIAQDFGKGPGMAEKDLTNGGIVVQ